MSEGKNVVRISDAAFEAVKHFAESREVSVGEAATVLVLRGDSRRAALDKYAKRKRDGVTTLKSGKRKVEKKRRKAKKEAKRAAKKPAAEFAVEE